MATTGKIEGGVMTLYKDVSGTDTKVACLTEVSFELSRDTIDVTCHESTGSWGDFLLGRKNGTVTASGYYAQDTSNVGYDDLYDDWTNGTTITARVSTEVSGDVYYEFSCLISSLSLAIPNKGEYTTYSVSLQITGDITKSTI